MSYVEIPNRDASPTIAGFVFQVNVTLLRWLDLSEGEHLELECGEDIDTVQTDHSTHGITAERRLLEQLKIRGSRSLTLRSPEALQSVANFCRHRAANPRVNLEFRYVTTAVIGVEQNWYRPESAIETWMALRRGRYDDSNRLEAVVAIRDFLVACERPDKTSQEAWDALQQALRGDHEVFLSEVVLPFEWGTGFGDNAQIEGEILASLSRGAYVASVQPEQIYEHLFAYLFRLLCQSGKKLLTIDGLAKELETPSVAPADRGILRLVRDELSEMRQEISSVKTAMVQQVNELGVLKQTVGMLGQGIGIDPLFALSAVSLSTDPPELVVPCARRDSDIRDLLARVQLNKVVALVGEPGSGKTQFLLLASARLERKKFWLNIQRNATEAQASILLEAFVRSVAGNLQQLPFRETCYAAAEHFRNGVIVIEDLPRVISGGRFASRVEVFARSVTSVDACLFLSSYFRMPAMLETSLGAIHYEVPRFRQNDVIELLSASKAPAQLRTEQTANLLLTVTEGLPTLVMAAIRYLINRNWNVTTTELDSLFRGEFAAAHRRDAGSLLQIVVPDATERELLIRMSLAVGDFSMEDIAKVARVPKSIPLPGEKVQRATGVWLQRTGDGRFSRSPLITASVADALDPDTRKGVHYVLAVRILARDSISPIEVFSCVSHLIMADASTLAVIVVLQILATFVEMDGVIVDDFGFARMWQTFPADVDLDLRLYLRAMQIVVLARQGRDVSSKVLDIDAMIAQAPSESWGAAAATGMLAINLVWWWPALANKYLAEALPRVSTARMLDGSRFPTGEYPLEIILWMSGYTAASDEDVDSWLATIARFTPAQIDILRSSELMEDNVTILCDGIWRRDYDKPEGERDWNHVIEMLDHVETTARVVGFELLEAAAIRTRIMVMAEWQHQLGRAVALSESSLARFPSADCRFLVLEVTGRQLSYAGESTTAIPWLEKALQCDAYHHSLWRRNVLITLAKLEGPQNPKKAIELTAGAIAVSEGPQQNEAIAIEALAEHGIAQWKAGDRLSSFDTFERAVNRLLASQSNAEMWKSLFFRLFAAVTYFSSVAQNGKPQEGHIEPAQGSFLAGREAHSFYLEEQQSYICIRLAMFADGIRDIRRAAAWTWQAIAFAQKFPAAWTGIRLLVYLAMPAALLADDFTRAAELAVLMSEFKADEIIAKANPAVAGTSQNPTAGTAEAALAVSSPTPKQSKEALLIIPFVPIAVRLAQLQLQDGTQEEIGVFLAEVDKIVPAKNPPQGFATDLERALLGDTNWQILQQDGFNAVKANDLVHGYTLWLGAVNKAPVAASLYLQTVLARHFEPLATASASLYREIISPMFRGYWSRTISQSVGLFRTALAYTERQLDLSDGSSEGTRRLLASMRFCLGLEFPNDTMAWLE